MLNVYLTTSRLILSGLMLAITSSAFATSGITYHGRILRPDNTPVDSVSTQFRIQIKTPGAESCLLWEEQQTKDLSSTNGVFTVTINDTSEPSLITNTLPFGIERVFSNRTNFSGLTGCSVGTTYNPSTADGRNLQVFFRENIGDPWEQMPLTKVNFVPLALNSVQLEGYQANEFLKIDPLSSYTTLSAANVNTLVDIIAGTSNQYLRPATVFAGDVTGTYNSTVVERIRGTGVTATVPTSGQVLKYDGTNWAPAADDVGAAIGDASYAAKGIVQINTDQATSGLFIASGVLAMPNVIAAAGPTGGASSIPILTYDAKGRLTAVSTATVDDTSKLPLAGGTMSGSLNMGAQTITNAASVSANDFSGRNFYHYNLTNSQYANIKAPDALGLNYTLTLPTTAPVAGNVLSTDASGNLSWIAAASGSVTSVTGTAPIVSSGGATPDISLNTGNGLTTVSNNLVVDSGLGINKIPQVGGTALGASGVVVANGTATALTSLNCALDQVIKFDASGFATCGSDNAGSASAFVQDGNTFGAAATLGTNDNFDLNLETNGTTKMTVLANGNVGIGTANPSSSLEIDRTVAGVNNAMTIRNSTPSSWGHGSRIKFEGAGGTELGSIQSVWDGTDSAYLDLNVLDGGVSQNVFRAWNGGIANHPQVSFGGYPSGSNPSSPARVRILSQTSTGNSQVNGLALQHLDSDGGGSNGIGNYLAFWAESSVNNSHAETGSILSVLDDADDNSKDGSLRFATLGPNAISATTAATEKMRIDSFGNVGIGTATPATKLQVAGTVKVADGAETCTIAGDGGMIRYSGTSLQFCNGSSWQTLGISGAGLTSLGGQTGSTQTFANGAAGTAPAFSSAADVHTLNIPLAAGAGVTSGTISKTEYDDFNAKLTSPLTTKGDLLSRDGATHVRLPAGTDGQVLSANSAEASGLQWIAAPTGDITEVVAGDGLTGGATSASATVNVAAGTGIVANADDVAVDVGLGIGKIPQVGGSALGANGVVVANGLGTALTSLNCTLDQVIKFDVTGFATCGTDVGSTGFIQNGNSFGAAATLGTNDNFDLNFETNGTTKMTVLVNGNVGIGTSNPLGKLDVRSNSALNAIISGGHGVASYGSFIGASSRGTETAPSASQNGDTLGVFGALGYGTNTFPGYSSGGMVVLASQNWTNSAQGSHIHLYTTPNGTAASQDRLTILNTGDVGIGTSSPQTTLQVAGVISPATNNTYTLGNASYRFTEVYATNGVINTSDRREKKDVYNTDLGLDFINKLRPVSYRWNTGVDSDVHYGLIAQETEQAIAAVGKNEKTSIVTHDEATDRYGVRYSELISPLIKAAQELYQRLLGVESDVAILKAKDAIKDREIASVKADNMAKNQEIERLKKENALIKSYICSQDPKAAICK